jgi:hypothetical protein
MLSGSGKILPNNEISPNFLTTSAASRFRNRIGVIAGHRASGSQRRNAQWRGDNLVSKSTLHLLMIRPHWLSNPQQ